MFSKMIAQEPSFQTQSLFQVQFISDFFKSSNPYDNVRILNAAWKSYSPHATLKSILERGSLYLYLCIYLFICLCVRSYTQKAQTFHMCIFPLCSGLNFQSFLSTIVHKDYVYCKSLCAWFFILPGWELACGQQTQICSSSTNFTSGSMQGWLSG
jgi:hypothetical protein